MKVTAKHNERIAKMTFSSIYPHYETKIEKKGITIDELAKWRKTNKILRENHL